MSKKTTIQDIMAAGARGILVIRSEDGQEVERWRDGPQEWQEILEQAVACWRLVARSQPRRKPSSMRLDDGSRVSIYDRGSLTIAIAYPPAMMLEQAMSRCADRLAVQILMTARPMACVVPAQAGI